MIKRHCTTQPAGLSLVVHGLLGSRRKRCLESPERGQCQVLAAPPGPSSDGKLAVRVI